MALGLLGRLSRFIVAIREQVDHGEIVVRLAKPRVDVQGLLVRVLGVGETAVPKYALPSDSDTSAGAWKLFPERRLAFSSCVMRVSSFMILCAAPLTCMRPLRRSVTESRSSCI